MTSCADELSQVLMHQSRGQHSLRLLLLVVIVLQLYISNSLSLPSICGIIMCCAVYAAYDAFKSKCFLDIKPLPSPSPSQELPQLPGAVLDPHHSELSQCPSSDAVSYGPLPSASLSLESVSGASSAAVQSEHLEIQRLHLSDAPQCARSCARELSVSASPWESRATSRSSRPCFRGKNVSPSTETAAALSLPSRPPTSTVFVGNMSSLVTENDLLQLFSSFGEIIVARVQRCTKQKSLKMCARVSSAGFCGFIFSSALT
jgi:hypothetical protein